MDASNYLRLILGAIIGGAFAGLQLLAFRRSELSKSPEKTPTHLRHIPDLIGRCAFLLMALMLVQVLFPTANPTWMSGGFFTAYTIPFLWRLTIK
jgi:hypothetical protein